MPTIKQEKTIAVHHTTTKPNPNPINPLLTTLYLEDGTILTLLGPPSKPISAITFQETICQPPAPQPEIPTQ